MCVARRFRCAVVALGHVEHSESEHAFKTPAPMDRSRSCPSFEVLTYRERDLNPHRQKSGGF